jgi:hypothetical protein
VVVCVLFIGYARQSGSILPAFAVFVAIVVDGVMRVMERIPDGSKQRWATRARMVLGVFVTVLAVACDVVTFARPEQPNVTGPVRPDGRWGGGAYLCPADMRLEVSASSSSPSR